MGATLCMLSLGEAEWRELGTELQVRWKEKKKKSELFCKRLFPSLLPQLCLAMTMFRLSRPCHICFKVRAHHFLSSKFFNIFLVRKNNGVPM